MTRARWRRDQHQKIRRSVTARYRPQDRQTKTPRAARLRGSVKGYLKVLGKTFIASAIRWRNPLMGIFLAPFVADLIVLAALVMMGVVR